jgi:hypothetical protein
MARDKKTRVVGATVHGRGQGMMMRCVDKGQPALAGLRSIATTFRWWLAAQGNPQPALDGFAPGFSP